ncbi:MAG: hypothetical protein ACKOYM_01565 [Actinomycetes bacterium]
MTDQDPDASPLPDGTYDVIVFNVDDSFDPSVLVVDLTVTAGEHRGMTMTLTAPSTLGTMVELIGMPGTLDVVQGTPTLTID